MDNLTIIAIGTGATFLCLALMNKKQRKTAGWFALFGLGMLAIGLVMTLLS